MTTSYFEWVQDRQGYFWKESVVNEQLESIMKSSFEDVVRYAETHHVNNRIAAYMLAIDRVAYTIRQRGIYAWNSVLQSEGLHSLEALSPSLDHSCPPWHH